MVTIKATLKKNQDKSGKYPLVIRITKDRKSVFINTNQRIDAKHWDNTQHRVKKSHPTSQRLNRQIADVHDYALTILQTNPHITALQIKQQYQAQTQATELATRIKTITRNLNRHLEKIQEKAGIEKKLSMHIAHHTFESLAGGSIPVQVLQKLYRHFSITTTVNYQRNFIHEETDEALEKVVNF
ncbi:MAG: tyrosine-type recombinase/integrase [Flavobacteriaceae bacterium]|nr:MAG: tyrosine-type recombinase/integrase [Flavobacteriaceae bacterium]